MYIDTTTVGSMETSVCQLLDINKIELDDLLEDCYNKIQVNHSIFILDDQYDYFYSYVKKHLIKEIDEIMFVHLSRRLNGDTDNNGYNLVDVLTKDTSLSSFLKDYGLTFQYDQYIKMYVQGHKVDLDKDNDIDYAYQYLKQRFGYLYKDYSIGGYAFCDNIDKSDYYEVAVGGPEFFGYLYTFEIDDDAIIDDFIDHSLFYQFEYVVPIDKVYFNDYEELKYQKKQYHILIKTLQRLYFYKYDNKFNELDNTTLGIKDDHVLPEDYLKNKIKI